MFSALSQNDFYRSADYSTICTLLYLGHTLEAIDKSDPTRCVFSVKKLECTDELLEQFHKGELLVEPKRFQAIQKELKGRIYN